MAKLVIVLEVDEVPALTDPHETAHYIVDVYEEWCSTNGGDRLALDFVSAEWSDS